jgi:hypothetical protein
VTAIEFRGLIETKGNLLAAQSVDSSVRNKQQADLLIFKYVTRLLSNGCYSAAAIILWGDKIFNPRPSAVRKIWKAIERNAKVLIQGCGSVGKSYTAVAWVLLDWWRDPEFTNIKIISTTKGHAKGNTFSTLVKLHKQACIKMPGLMTSDYIGLDTKERKSGISVVAIPIGDDGQGRLQGFHPDPRPVIHPILGPSSRVRALMDECEEIPAGVWEGVDNMLVAMEGADTIKIIGAYNPKDQTSKTAQNAEPPEGWDTFDIERGVAGSNEWTSKNGWFVLRIDGKETENVKARKMVYPGFMTYSGFRELEVKDGGNSVNYYTFGRGAYPPEGAVGVLIGTKLLQDARGDFVFLGPPVKCAGVDVAVDGRDNCVLTTGRTGMASAFQPKKGPLVKFKEPRRVLQVDQQFTLKKGNTKIVGDAIFETCLKLGISPENLSIDATGNGSAVFSYLKAIWSEDVQGIDFNSKASDIKILEQDQYTPEELYEGIVSEVWFALAKWLEFGFVAVSPGLRKEPVEAELTSRRYVLGAGKKLRVEKKDDYKKRLGAKSPDFADSMTVIVHGVRRRENIMGSMVDEEAKPTSDIWSRRDESSEIDRAEWLDTEGV